MSAAYQNSNYKKMKKMDSSKKDEKSSCGCDHKNEFMPLMDPNNLKIKKVGK